MKLTALWVYPLLCLSLLLPSAAAQQPIATPTPSVQRDPQALTVLQAALTAMGGATMPSDSTATGTVTTTAGSLTESGSITILTKGADQTSEQIQTPHGSTFVYSSLQASQTNDSVLTPLSMELAASTQSLAFPLPIFGAALNNQDYRFVYLGLELQNGQQLHHLQIWNSLASQPRFQFLSPLTLRDVWIDAVSSLPQRISQIRRAGRGSEPSIQLDTYFSNYQSIGGVLYPFSIQESVNGSPGWISRSQTSVSTLV